MKKYYLRILSAFIIFFLFTFTTFANVTVTAATGGTNLPGSRAVNGISPSWTTLGDIVITEGLVNDINNGNNQTLILTAPSNWQFNPVQGSVTIIPTRDITAITIAITTATITITFSTDNGISGRNDLDQITISGIQVQAIDGTVTTLVEILRTVANPGTATIAGITNGTTNFGRLSSDGVLPVELTSFKGSTYGKNVKLNWATATEVSNFGFEVERLQNYNIEKLQDWEKIGFVEGYGNSNSPKDYSFIDQNVSGGKYSYRLKQIDTDGKFEYSKVIEVDLGSPAKFELNQNYPNPFNPSTIIKFSLPQSANVKLTVYNLLGEEITTLVNEFKEAGVYIVNFDATALNSGIYIYKIETDGFVQSRKMTLIK